ncbi:MAG: extracellular solute-binding protein, partial [Deltaproteobacteria bacterium]|nr:extracellular solute-binding protein [Deltaproteobacteria bacterium]
ELHRRAVRRAVLSSLAQRGPAGGAGREARDDHDTVPVDLLDNLDLGDDDDDHGAPGAHGGAHGAPGAHGAHGARGARGAHGVDGAHDDHDDNGDDEPPKKTGGGADKKTGGSGGKKRLLGLFALAMLLACDRPSDGVVLWHAYNGVERETLEASAARWNAAHPETPLELVSVPYGAFGDKLTSAIPGGNGPDLFIYSQDRIGDWAGSSIIEPIEFWVDDARLERFSEPAVAAMAYGNSLYGLPLATKSLALFYRTDLVDRPPATTDELLAIAPRMRARRGYAVAYANVDLYGHAPWLFGFGGSIMTETGELAIATPEAANAMAFARDLVATGAAPEHAEGPLVATLFNEGKAATAISGPWFVADIRSDVPWKVATLPVVSPTGAHAAPFLGAEGILMSARARDKNAAFAVMDALVSDENATERARRARQVVPNRAAYDDPDVARDPTLNAFRAQLAHTVPMPKSAGMRMVWTPYKTALGEVLAGRSEPGPQLRSVEREVQKYLDGRSN